MILLSQPGGAGEITKDGLNIVAGTLCYLSAPTETKEWHWKLDPPKGSIAELHLRGVTAAFPPDIKGKYKITFTGSDGKPWQLTVTAI